MSENVQQPSPVWQGLWLLVLRRFNFSSFNNVCEQSRCVGDCQNFKMPFPTISMKLFIINATKNAVVSCLFQPSRELLVTYNKKYVKKFQISAVHTCVYGRDAPGNALNYETDTCAILPSFLTPFTDSICHRDYFFCKWERYMEQYLVTRTKMLKFMWGHRNGRPT